MSPASACCLRSSRRRPTRSISAAIWRPFKVCRGRRQRNFFSQRLGQLGSADADPRTRFDFGAQPGDCPIAPIGHGFLQQGRDHTQRCFTLHRGRAGRRVGLERRNAAAQEVAAPQANRIFAHTNASAIRRLVQPASVSSVARARSASPRSRDKARTPRAARSSSVAASGDFPAMARPRESVPAGSESDRQSLVKQPDSA